MHLQFSMSGMGASSLVRETCVDKVAFLSESIERFHEPCSLRYSGPFGRREIDILNMREHKSSAQ